MRSLAGKIRDTVRPLRVYIFCFNLLLILFSLRDIRFLFGLFCFSYDGTTETAALRHEDIEITELKIP